MTTNPLPPLPDPNGSDEQFKQRVQDWLKRISNILQGKQSTNTTTNGIAKLSQAPNGVSAGYIYFDTTKKQYYGYNGSAWEQLGGGGSGGAVTSVNKQTGDVTITAGNIGADPAGTASAAVATETARAESAENTLTTNLNTKVTGIGTQRLITGPTFP